MSEIQLKKDNKALSRKLNKKLKRLDSLNKKLSKRSKYMPLQGVWALKDEIKHVERAVLLIEQQIKFNLLCIESGQ